MDTEDRAPRHAPLEISPEDFRTLGYRLVDRIADYLEALPHGPVTPAEPLATIRGLLGAGGMPRTGSDPAQLLDDAASLVFNHSLFNGHPRFLGYVTSSPAPIGALGDLLAAAANPNTGAWILSPMATEIEAQTVRWLAELIGYPATCGGLLVSGGNLANIVPFIAARNIRAPWDVHALGMGGEGRPRLRVYATHETHTWLDKAVDVTGLGTQAIHWIPTDSQQRMDVAALEAAILADKAQGDWPLAVVGSAGTVSTGAVDPLPAIAALARKHGLWFHVDGAYGGLAAMLLPEPSAVRVPEDLRGIAEADSVAIDPHKWLYAPLEAGCTLVRDAAALRATYSHQPPYYHFEAGEEPVLNFFEYGLQNSRGFRALKVWLGLRQVGRAGYARMLSDDIALAEALYHRLAQDPEVQAVTQNLSVTTFRYVPSDLIPGRPDVDIYLNELNNALLTALQRAGELFVSNAVVHDMFLLRSCIVNFRTSMRDIEALPGIVVRSGRAIDRDLRPQHLQG
jgi:glutamate/tyrosine decarboxylase-like PLP-dependent enzyme